MSGVRPFVEMMQQSAGGGGAGDLTALVAGTGIDISSASGPEPTVSIAALYRSSTNDFFSTGVDGAVTVNAGGTVTATGNYYPTTLAVSNTTALDLANFGIFASTSVTVDAGSSINNDGQSASVATQGASKSAGALGPATTAGIVGGSAAGGASANMTAQLGGRGGAGGAGSGGAGGNAGTKTAPTASRGGANAYSVPAFILSGFLFPAGTGVACPSWGGGGGGGGGDGGSGGGGGAGAGGVWVAAPTITNNGAIRAHGGAGGTPAGGNRGGGGGGGGGGVLTSARVYAGSGTYTATGGTGGTKTGTGVDGSSGQDGVVAQFTA